MTRVIKQLKIKPDVCCLVNASDVEGQTCCVHNSLFYAIEDTDKSRDQCAIYYTL